MDLLYPDYNCFQRGFDDVRQTRIRMEALACEELFLLAEDERVKLVWSFMHEDETILCPFPERIDEVRRLSLLCDLRLGPEKDIHIMAKSFHQLAGLTPKDALHLASAFYIKADFFITCDDLLVKRAQRLNLEIKIMNPIDYVRHEVNK
jgi:hypothetical protein